MNNFSFSNEEKKRSKKVLNQTSPSLVMKVLDQQVEENDLRAILQKRRAAMGEEESFDDYTNVAL